MRAQTIALFGLLVAPFAVLAVLGMVHLTNGLAVDNAFPVPLYASIDVSVSRQAYLEAAKDLEFSNRDDGNARIALAEARWRMNEPPALLAPAAADALLRAPATAEGWALYAELKAPQNTAAANLALDQSYILAPRDFYLMLRRTELAARLGNRLQPSVRREALEQIRAMWGDWGLKDSILVLLQSPDGRDLVQQAYLGDKQTPALILNWAIGRHLEVSLGKP